jgi:hypothetical protein
MATAIFAGADLQSDRDENFRSRLDCRAFNFQFSTLNSPELLIFSKDIATEFAGVWFGAVFGKLDRIID